MLKAKRSKHKALNNKGSAIVTVVVSMLFVMALGAALLFTAYTAYSVEITQRGDKANFYDASSAMDEIRLGIQNILSDSVAAAYTDVLVDYVGEHDAGYDPQTEFNNKIVTGLIASTANVGGLPKPVFTASLGSISGYNADALQTYIDSAEQSYATVSGSGSVKRTFSDDGVLQSITLQSISVKYIKGGYESNITTDITITMPYFFSSFSVASGINNYAIIAGNALIHDSGMDTTVEGSVFVGNRAAETAYKASADKSRSYGIQVTGGGNSISFLKGDLICRGPISVEEGSAFRFFASGNELWANNINIGTSGTLTLDGNTYVANDLLLNGNGASVTLKNTYFGFGDSETDSSASSSILVNGQKCNLDISGLSKLSLAGISFINTIGTAPDNTSIPMGQSMSIKSDQLAYLVPIGCIANYSANPCVFTGDTIPAPDIDYSTVLWGTGDEAKTLLDYIDKDDTGTKGKVMTLYKTIVPETKTKVVYVFLVFKDKAYANKYFKDFFAADPTRIGQYMSIYLDKLNTPGSAKINTAGNTFYEKDGTTLTLNPASDEVYAAGIQLLYDKMDSPYQAFVNDISLSKLGSGTTLEFRDSHGNVAAVVSTSDTEHPYNYDSSKSATIHLIIAKTNVTISKSFNGIVIAGNNVTVNADVEGAALTSDILNSTCTVGTTKYTLSDFINNSAQIEGNSGVSEDLWDLDTLVSYENWDKH